MGYKRNKTYTLYFDDPDLEGLEIVVKGASIARMMQAATLAEGLEGIRGIPTQEQKDQVEDLLRLFAGCPLSCEREHDGLDAGQHYTSRIVSWNFLDDEDRPLYPNYENFADQDMDFTVPVIFAWIDAAVSTPGPLDSSLNDGGPSGVESIPMEALSPVPAL